MTDTTAGPAGAAHDRGEWESWCRRRERTVQAPYGPLSVTGTHWLAEAGAGGRVEGLPGSWSLTPGTDEVLLAASAEEGVTVDGAVLDGRTALGEDDEGYPGASRAAHGQRRLVLLRRDGQWAVRVFDPAAPAREGFTGIDVFPYDQEWVRAGLFRPYGEGERSVLVGNADGRERGLGLSGELAFTAPGHEEREAALQVAVEHDGGLWAVLADRTSGVEGSEGSYRFRFLKTRAPDAAGAVTVDFNRLVLPPCAFTDHFLCPFPPPGNRLPFGIPAGERAVRSDG